MADFDRDKKDTPGIPVPAAAVPSRTQPVSRTRKCLILIFKLATLAWILATVVRSRTRGEVLEELDLHEGRWLARIFSDSSAWSPRKALYGKKAEQVFLCASIIS